MSTPRRRLALLIGLALTLALSTSAVAPAAVGAHGRTTALDLPERIELPDGFQPEGITGTPWGTLWAGSRTTGAIWKGSAVTGDGDVLVDPVEGRAALGLHVDWLGRLWVSGGGNGTIRVYKARTGELLQTYTFPTTGFINDLAITPRGVYATDSINQQLAVVPLGAFGRLTDPDEAFTLPLTGEIAYEDGFNANGIVARHGKLILVQSNTGELFRVDPGTGFARTIDTGGESVLNGDGLVLRGRTLYVVRNQNELVPVFRLSWNSLVATFKGNITSANPDDLDVPTTGTFAAGALWVVNARFGVASPETAPYWITRLPSTP
jgi:hypothetical protein